MKQPGGFTLLELLFAMALFSTVLATVFSVFSTLRRAERFREENVRLTRAATFAYEPLIRTLKGANGVISTPVGDNCLALGGFYLEDEEGPLVALDEVSSLKTLGLKLVTVASEAVFDQRLGATKTWVKRVYDVRRDGPSGHDVLYETTYQVADNRGWPQPLNNCREVMTWVAVGGRSLTPSNTQVDDLTVRFITPVLKPLSEGGPRVILTRSPFISLKLILSLPKSLQFTPPVTLASTVVPTLTYGEQRD